MEFLLELVGEIFFEGIVEIIKNNKISKWIRYPLFILINLFYLAIFGIMLIIDAKLFAKKEIFGGMILLLIVVILLVLWILFLRNLTKK